MKKFLLIQYLLFFSFHSFSQSYVTQWNAASSTLEIFQINLNTGNLTAIGTSSIMSYATELNEFYYDKTNNQLVSLYQFEDLWQYDLTTNTENIIALELNTYKNLIVTDQKSYLTAWNSTNNNYEIKEINLKTGAITDVGTTSVIDHDYDINLVYYDKTNNQLVGLYQDTDLWKYNLNTNTDQILDLGTVSYISLLVSDQKSYLNFYNSTNSNNEIKEINLSTGVITHVGTSFTTALYNIFLMYYDQANNQLVALYGSRDLWKYDLSSNTDQVVDLAGNTQFNIAVYNDASVTGLVDPTQFQQQDEIVKIYDAMGNELTSMESDKMMIVKYKSGKVRKVYIK
jgi:hypothetical protein